MLPEGQTKIKWEMSQYDNGLNQKKTHVATGRGDQLLQWEEGDKRKFASETEDTIREDVPMDTNFINLHLEIYHQYTSQ